MEPPLDCILCGSCVADVIVRPFPLDLPVGHAKVLDVEPIRISPGGLVSNAGAAMARLGMKAAAFCHVGDDGAGAILRRALDREGVDTGRMIPHSTVSTTTCAVLIDPCGERSFAYGVGATETIDRRAFLDNMDLFKSARLALVGYYSFLPNLESDLPEVMSAIRAAGCQTALDSAGEGGGIQPLDRILPHLDVYVPSLAEAANQTGKSDPREIIEAFRQCGAPGILGVKLGADGAMLSSEPGRYVKIDPAQPPGDVVDTTGAGDAFYAGLVTGLLRGMSVEDSGRLAAAAGASCVTRVGTTEGLRNYTETARLAGLTN